MLIMGHSNTRAGRKPREEHAHNGALLLTCRAETQRRHEKDHARNDNSVAFVCERTRPTERPPFVGQVSANFCGLRGVACSVGRIPYGAPTFSSKWLLNCCKIHTVRSLVNSSGVLTRLRGPVSEPLLLRKSSSAGNLTRTSGSVARYSDH
jgi:hypothetical protein